MDIIFKRSYKESNNFIEFWGSVIFYFHTERGLFPDITTREAEKWYIEHRKKMLDLDIVEKKFTELMNNYKGEIPEWDGVSGVKELDEKLEELFKKEDQRIFNHNKKEELSGNKT